MRNQEERTDAVRLPSGNTTGVGTIRARKRLANFIRFARDILHTNAIQLTRPHF